MDESFFQIDRGAGWRLTFVGRSWGSRLWGASGCVPRLYQFIVLTAEVPPGCGIGETFAARKPGSAVKKIQVLQDEKSGKF